ncbi:MAG TPA: hypothetical protein VGD80_42370 [Kofleriaceae bacterium]
MSTPVTRGELKDELAALRKEFREETAPLATKAELREAIAPLATKAELREAIQKAIAPLATKAELEIWGGALLARIQSTEQGLKEHIKTTEQGLKELIKATEQGLKELIKATEKQLQTDLARHAGVLQEWMSSMITAYDDKYADLPGRVKALETRVFGPK